MSSSSRGQNQRVISSVTGDAQADGGGMPSPTRCMTLRLDAQDHQILQLIARANGRSVTAEIRDAVDKYIGKRKASPEFQRKLKARIKELEALRV